MAVEDILLVLVAVPVAIAASGVLYGYVHRYTGMDPFGVIEDEIDDVDIENNE